LRTMEDLSLHILDIIDNSMAAGASEIGVRIEIDTEKDILFIEIKDNGQGMNAETAKKAIDPFYSSKMDKRIGLGIPLLAQAAREGGGELTLKSETNRGTKVMARFQLSHPDRKPLGDVEETIYILQKTHPDITFSFELVRK